MCEQQSRACGRRAPRDVAFRDELEPGLGGTGVLEDDGRALVRSHLAGNGVQRGSEGRPYKQSRGGERAEEEGDAGRRWGPSRRRT